LLIVIWLRAVREVDRRDYRANGTTRKIGLFRSVAVAAAVRQPTEAAILVSFARPSPTAANEAFASCLS